MHLSLTLVETQNMKSTQKHNNNVYNRKEIKRKPEKKGGKKKNLVRERERERDPGSLAFKTSPQEL